MNFRKNILSNSFIFSLLLIVVIFSLGAMKVYQTGKLESNGSGSIKITYSAKADELKTNKYIIGNFPFSEDLAKKQFASANNTVKNVKLDFDKKESVYYMTVEVDFKDINKITEAKGFSNIKASYVKSSSGMDFQYIILANPGLYKNFANQSYIIEFESKVKTTNGALKDNTVTWGNKNSSNSDFSKDVILKATTEADESLTSNNESSGKDEGKS